MLGASEVEILPLLPRDTRLNEFSWLIIHSAWLGGQQEEGRMDLLVEHPCPRQGQGEMSFRIPSSPDHSRVPRACESHSRWEGAHLGMAAGIPWSCSVSAAGEQGARQAHPHGILPSKGPSCTEHWLCPQLFPAQPRQGEVLEDFGAAPSFVHQNKTPLAIYQPSAPQVLN